MKTKLKIFATILACCALLGQNAMAKKDKSEDSKKQKNGESEYRKPQTAPGTGGINASPQANQRPNYEKRPQQVVPKPKNNTSPQGKSKQPPMPDTAAPKKNQSTGSKQKEDVPSGKNKTSSKKSENPTPENKRDDKDSTTNRNPKNESSSKQNDNESSGKNPQKTDTQGKIGESKNDGDRKDGDRKDGDRKDGDRKDGDKKDGDKKDGDKKDGDKKDGDKKDGDKKRDNAMILPGTRPVVPGAHKNKGSDQAQISRSGKKDGEQSAKGKIQAESQKKPVVRPGQNSKPVRRPDLNQKDSNAWWNRNNNPKNKHVEITNVKNVTHINNNFQKNVNWSTRRHHWGYNPWWNRPVVRPWYGRSWSCGWNRSYYDHHYHYGYGRVHRLPGYYQNDVAEAIGWGLIGWSLGTLIYDTGYRVYHNPYPVQPVYITETESLTYNEPITRTAVRLAPEDDTAVAEATAKSESLIGESQAAFKEGNYVVALELANKSIAQSPGDGALHEFRALILFALGKYGEAAGVLNPVLASGPGWDWPTMIALYGAQQTYTDQLQRLEAYSVEKPDAADTHFLLGYHYMVCGHLDLATPQFELAHKLMPSDNVSRELAELTRSSKKSADEPEADIADEPADSPRPDPVPLEKLAGMWVSNRDAGSSITLTFKDDGTFTWAFVKDGKSSDMSGEYSLNDDGLLVLDSGESQMVAEVKLMQDREMKFTLAGGPPADPGLAFSKSQ